MVPEQEKESAKKKEGKERKEGEEMNWDSVRKFIGSQLPTIGAALAGPAGAAVGKLVGSVLGVEPEPDKVLEVLKTNPDAMVKLKEFELRHKERLEELAVEAVRTQVEALRAINETMRAEAASEHWPQYSWRPAIGFAVAISFVGMVYMVGWLFYQAIILGQVTALTYLPQLLQSYVALLWPVAAILGVAAWHRGKEKRIKAGEAPAEGKGLFGKLGDLITGRPEAEE